MKKIFFIIRLQSIASLYCCLAYGQNSDGAKSILAKLTAFCANHPTEKAYLQFDKPYYAAGDTIYFKAYITSGEQHQLSNLSKVLHVDFINANNKTGQSIKLQIDSGVAWGDFALPDSLPKGNYRVRAYTQWMRNEGEKDFFDKVLPVGPLANAHVPESMVKQPKAINLKPDVQFLPEGGGLVTGIRSKVAFKATGSDGMGIDLKGMVTDNDGREIVSFAPAHLGMGYFYLAPAAGKTYKTEITYADGTRGTLPLPKPETAGLVLSVDNDSLPKASVTITANTEYYNQHKNEIYTLVIYSGGIATTVSCKLDSPVIKLDILKRKLHTGIATVTLFAPGHRPLCERLFFVQNYDELTLNLNPDKNSYAKRGKATIKINAVNRKGDPAAGHFSVSVIDESKVPADENNEDNILSYLLCTSDLKGYIEQPGYYFADTSSSASKNLDMLLLTQGYRRFEWKQVLNSTSEAPAYQPEKGIAISGQIKNLFNKPIAKGMINLIPSKGGQFMSATSDDKGMFHFSNLVFTDTVHFVLSAVNARGKNWTKITYFDDKDTGPAVTVNKYKASQIADTVMKAYVENDKLEQAGLVNDGILKGKMLKAVKIKARKIEPLTISKSWGIADQVISGDQIEYGGTLAVRLMSKLNGVHFVPVNGIWVPVLNRNAGGGGPMIIILDDEEIAPEELSIINTGSIEKVEVMKNATVSPRGVMIITTNHGLQTKDIIATGVLPIAPAGFYKAREFYSPKYDNAGVASKHRDLRSTIYWKPEIQTDKDGNASFDYYNADGMGVYKIVVEGIDNNGDIGRQVYRYKVE